MPYQPGIQDISGQLLAQGGANAASIRLAGSQAMAQGISHAGSAIASGIEQAGQKYQQAKGLDAAADALGNSGMVDAAWLDKFHSANLAGKTTMMGTITPQLLNGLQTAQARHLNAVTGQINAETDAVKQAATAAQGNLQRALQFQQRINKLRGGAGGEAPAAAPAATPAPQQPGPPGMTAAQLGLSTPNAENPFNKPLSAQDIYAYQ